MLLLLLFEERESDYWLSILKPGSRSKEEECSWRTDSIKLECTKPDIELINMRISDLKNDSRYARDT